MPSLKDLPGNLNRRKLTKALSRLGFVINQTGGKGSHYKITWPKNQKSLTIPHNNLPKQVLYYILKEIKKNSGVDWKEIKEKL